MLWFSTKAPQKLQLQLTLRRPARWHIHDDSFSYHHLPSSYIIFHVDMCNIFHQIMDMTCMRCCLVPIYFLSKTVNVSISIARCCQVCQSLPKFTRYPSNLSTFKRKNLHLESEVVGEGYEGTTPTMVDEGSAEVPTYFTQARQLMA